MKTEEKQVFDCNSYRTCIKENNLFLQIHRLISREQGAEVQRGDWATQEQMDILHNRIRNLIYYNLFPRIGEVLESMLGISHIIDITYRIEDSKTIIDLYIY